MFIYLENEYYDQYIYLIANAQSEHRKKISREKTNHVYYESHHILPTSMGGQGNRTNTNHPNIVLLTAQEHFDAHILLTKFTTGYDLLKMIRAAHFMSTSRENIKIDKYTFQFLRESFAKIQSEQRKDRTKYTWIHDEHGTHYCSTWDLIDLYPTIITVSEIRKVKNGWAKSHKGWRLVSTDTDHANTDKEEYEWKHNVHGTYVCSIRDLIEMFPELTVTYLRSTKLGYQKSHKGWKYIQ